MKLEFRFRKVKERKQKISNSKSRLLVVGILAFHLLFLASEKEFLHNHKPDGRTHDDCPVFIINNILTTGITTHFEIFTGQFVEIFIPFTTELLFSKPDLYYIQLRAPPIS